MFIASAPVVIIKYEYRLRSQELYPSLAVFRKNKYILSHVKVNWDSLT